MAIRSKNNPTPAPETVDAYRRAASVANKSDVWEEHYIGMVVGSVIGDAQDAGDNVTDAVMACLARFGAATRRIREELRAIHS